MESIKNKWRLCINQMSCCTVIMGKTPTMRPVSLLHTLYLIPQKVEDNVYSAYVSRVFWRGKWKLGLETGIGLFLPPGKWDLSPWDWQLVTGDEKNGNEIKISSHHFFVNFEHVYPDPACTELVTISRLQNDIKYGGILIPSSWILVYRNTF